MDAPLSKLEKAERCRIAAEAERGPRPAFHFTPPVGWLNDPNGFSLYQDRIHLFYQYHPFSDTWGPMYWGHAISADFLRWDDLPVALAPDTPQDAGGCFSGSAVAAADGRQALVYTGTRKKRGGGGRETLQEQCLAMGDGVTYGKWPRNPVIPASMLPEGFAGHDFRDPKVWRDHDRYRLVAVAADAAGMGHVLQYGSDNLEHWEYEGDIAASDGAYGDMWECPDLFDLGGHAVLMVSTMHMPRIAGYHDAYGCVAFQRDAAGRWDVAHARPVDWGRDFYAAQTMTDMRGRRVMISWLQSWDNFIKPRDLRWHGMMSVPRELSWKDGKMLQRPVQELLGWRREAVSLETAAPHTHGPDGRVADIEVHVPPAAEGELRLRLAQRGGRAIVVSWRAAERSLCIDRAAWSPNGDKYAVQSMPVEGDAGLDLRVVLDTCSIELFVGDGRQAMSATYYAPLDAGGFSVERLGSVRASVVHHALAAPGSA